MASIPTDAERNASFRKSLSKMVFVYLALERGYRIKMVGQDIFEMDREEDTVSPIELTPTNQLIRFPTSL